MKLLLNAVKVNIGLHITNHLEVESIEHLHIFVDLFLEELRVGFLGGCDAAVAEEFREHIDGHSAS